MLLQADIYQTGANELFEETGIRVEKDRLRLEHSRQAAATVATHHVNLFSVELSADELSIAKKAQDAHEAFGNMEQETEQTFIEVFTVRELLGAGLVDFSTLGLIMQSIGAMYDAIQDKETMPPK